MFLMLLCKTYYHKQSSKNTLLSPPVKMFLWINGPCPCIFAFFISSADSSILFAISVEHSSWRTAKLDSFQEHITYLLIAPGFMLYCSLCDHLISSYFFLFFLVPFFILLFSFYSSFFKCILVMCILYVYFILLPYFNVVFVHFSVSVLYMPIPSVPSWNGLWGWMNDEFQLPQCLLPKKPGRTSQ